MVWLGFTGLGLMGCAAGEEPGIATPIVITATAGPTATERVVVVTATPEPATPIVLPVVPTLTPNTNAQEPTPPQPAISTAAPVPVDTREVSPPATQAPTPKPIETREVVVVPIIRLPELEVFVVDGNNAQVIVKGSLVAEEFMTFGADACSPDCATDKTKTGFTQVDFRFFKGTDLDSDPVYEHRETRVTYCAFGGDEECNVWNFAKNKNRWPNGVAIEDGDYVLQVRALGNDQNNAFWQGATRFKINQVGTVAPVTPQRVTVQDNSDAIEASITYLPSVRLNTPFFIRVAAKSKGAQNDGDGIASVDIEIVDANGNRVHQRTERTAGYCSFGGGEPDCTAWTFDKNKFKWPNGTGLSDGLQAYAARVQVTAENGQVAQGEVTFQIAGP